jgi:lysyl-tRNA synthetase class II
MLELYQAFADYTEVMAITEQLIRHPGPQPSAAASKRVLKSQMSHGHPPSAA